MADEHKKRLLFREVNARIRQINDRLWLGDGILELLCECGHEGCVQRMEVAPDVYAQARADDRAFLVAAGHERPGRDRVAAEFPTYRIVVPTRGRARTVSALAVPAPDPLPG